MFAIAGSRFVLLFYCAGLRVGMVRSVIVIVVIVLIDVSRVFYWGLVERERRGLDIYVACKK